MLTSRSENESYYASGSGGVVDSNRSNLCCQSPHGHLEVNEGKSKFAPGAIKNTTVTYTPAKGDMIKCVVDGVDKDDKPIHWTWVGKFDGKPYQIKGSPSFDTLTYKPVNDRTNKTTATKAGKVVMTGTITVAKDGKSRVVTLTGTGANGQKFTDMTYYDKQQ